MGVFFIKLTYLQRFEAALKYKAEKELLYNCFRFLLLSAIASSQFPQFF